MTRLNSKRIDSVCIGVISHRSYAMPSDAAYLPIWVGPEKLKPHGFVSHAEGDGIPQLNDAYCELTGLYWLWKNIHSECKGIVHYRRIFAEKPTRKIGRVLKSEDYLAGLLRVDVMLPPRQTYPGSTVAEHYISSKKGYERVHQDDITALINAMRSVHPSYSPWLSKVLNSNCCHMRNIFCMRGDRFNEYCSWLFPLMDEFVALRVNREDQRRFVGAISEFMIDVWLSGTGFSYGEFNLYEPEQRVIRGFVNRVFCRPRQGVLHEMGD